MQYEIPLFLDAGKAIASVGQLLDSLNAGLAAFGVEERLVYGGEIGTFTLTTDRPPSTEERKTIRELVQKVLRERGLPLDALPLREKSVSPGCQSESR